MTQETWRLIEAAQRRALVRLPDGREGRLMFVGKRSHKVKVQVGGRHEWGPASAVEVVG